MIRAHQVRSYGPGVEQRPSDSGDYEIRVEGRLDARWSAWFDGLVVTPGGHGTTVIRGSGIDQAALHGLLRRLSDLALPLLSVNPTRPDEAGRPTTESDHHEPRRTP